MTTTHANDADTVTREGYCIVGCAHDNVDYAHGPYCERSLGSSANGVTEPGLDDVQFWCSVIAPYIHGAVSREHARDCDQYRDGVRLVALVRDESCDDAGPGWREVGYNLTAGEARSLAALLVAAADSHDGINQSHLLAAKNREAVQGPRRRSLAVTSESTNRRLGGGRVRGDPLAVGRRGDRRRGVVHWPLVAGVVRGASSRRAR